MSEIEMAIFMHEKLEMCAEHIDYLLQKAKAEGHIHEAWPVGNQTVRIKIEMYGVKFRMVIG